MRTIYVSSSTSGSEFSVSTPRTIKNDDRGTFYCSNEVRTFRYLFTVRAEARTLRLPSLLFERKREPRQRIGRGKLQRQFQHQRQVVLGQ